MTKNKQALLFLREQEGILDDHSQIFRLVKRSNFQQAQTKIHPPRHLKVAFSTEKNKFPIISMTHDNRFTQLLLIRLCIVIPQVFQKII